MDSRLEDPFNPYKFMEKFVPGEDIPALQLPSLVTKSNPNPFVMDYAKMPETEIYPAMVRA